MKKILQLITTIQFGQHLTPGNTGEVLYLKVNHIDEQGMLAPKNEIETRLNYKKVNPNLLLKDGDILLAGKGFRNIAWYYQEEIGPAIASSVFFIIRVTAPEVLPKYLTLFLNMPRQQAILQMLGAGTSFIPSIRKLSYSTWKSQFLR
ncbi:MAG: hypothetical protein R3B47_02795 [Bacteroidia bacterium]